MENSRSNSSVSDWSLSHVCLSLFTAYFCYNLLLSTLLLLVLYVGSQRWRKQRSGAGSEGPSHSDVFTFNVVALQLIAVLGSCVYCSGMYADRYILIDVGSYLWAMVSPAETFFHVFTCVERYLAVVRPVTYLGLKGAGVVRVRNASVGCVWLVCLCFPTLRHQRVFPVINLLCLSVSSVIVVLCSLSVLCALIRPGPGEVGGNRERVNQSKRRAFHTLTGITGALLFKFICNVCICVLPVLSDSTYDCLITWSVAWLTVPSTLILPLLFLQRAGKLPA